MNHRSIVAVLLLTASCASKPPAKAPEWTEVPQLVSEAACARIRSEAISGEAPVAIIRTTQPLITSRAITSLGHSYYKQSPVAVQVADAIASSVKSIPVAMTTSGSCAFEAIDTVAQHRDADTLLLQFSSPFVNPFVRTESGMFVRLSLGNHDSSWYWLPLANRQGQWMIGTMLLLDLHEE